MNSCLEQLLALRPGDEKPETIQGAIDAIKVLKEQFRHEEKRLSHFKQHTMLMSPMDEIKEAEDRLLELARVPAQADELLKGLEEKLHEANKKIVVADLSARRAALARKKNEFEKRFHAFYAPAVAQFVDFMQEDDELKAETAALNFEIEQCGKEFFYTENSFLKPQEIDNLREHNIDPAYEAVTILPAPNMLARTSGHIPLAYTAETKRSRAIAAANEARAASFNRLQGEKAANSY